MKVVSKVRIFPSNPVEGGYYYNTTVSTLGIYKEGNWSFHYPLVETNKKEGDLAFDINGYYPLYLTEDEAKDASSLSSAHSHEIDGVTYYMPDGGIEGKDFFHGTFGDTSYWYQKQGPLPSWITPPPQDATVTQALVTLTNPDTGETYTVPTGGYTVNIDSPDDPVDDPVAPDPVDNVDPVDPPAPTDPPDVSDPDYPANTYTVQMGDTSGVYTFGVNDRLRSATGRNLDINISVGDTLIINNTVVGAHPLEIRDGNGGAPVSNPAATYDPIDDQGKQRIEWTPTTPGTYVYQCTNHGSMVGNIIVRPKPSTYSIGVGGSLNFGYVISGNDANGSVSGSTININAGDTIILNNQISADHPLAIRVSDNGPAVSNPSADGQMTAQVTWTPITPGNYVYQCTNHASMLGNIIVS